MPGCRDLDIVPVGACEVATYTSFLLLQGPRDKLVCLLNCCRVINNILTTNVKAEGIGKLLILAAGSAVCMCEAKPEGYSTTQFPFAPN